MLKKSKKSAYALACIFLLIAIVTRFIGEMITGYETGVYGLILRYQAGGAIMIAFLLFIPIIMIAAGVLSLFIYCQNDDHYGRWGAIRWGIAGMIYGVLKVGINHLTSMIGLSSIGKLAEDLLGFLAIVVSYGMVFMVLPWVKKRFEVARAQ